ncbi:MAG: hypothetical protein IRZ00_11440 [Gemmatimonadetes bacterium]|nr:hypothetical protein [Gemmatimonadota bacterium]
MSDTETGSPAEGPSPGRPAAAGRRVRRALTWALAIVVAVPLVYPASKAVEAALWPWSAAWLGHPTLTGEWVGAFATGDGRRHAAYLDLRLAASPDADGNLKGAARFCAGPAADEYPLHGRTADRHGHRFTLGLDDGPDFVEAGTKPEGEWSGDAIVLRYQPPRYDERGNPLHPPPAPPIRLTRGTSAAFTELCRGLLRRPPR